MEGPFHKKCEGLLPPGSAVVQRRTNSRRESRALQFLRISKEMLENLVNIGIKNKKFIFHCKYLCLRSRLFVFLVNIDV